MKTIRIASAVFLGRNTGNLVMRFEYHFWALIALLLLTAAGSGMQSVAKLFAVRSMPVSDGLVSVIEFGDMSMIGAFVLGGYILFLTTVLTLAGLFLAGTTAEGPSAEA